MEVVGSSMGSCRCGCIIEGVILWDRKNRIQCMITDPIAFKKSFVWTVTGIRWRYWRPRVVRGWSLCHRHRELSAWYFSLRIWKD